MNTLRVAIFVPLISQISRIKLKTKLKCYIFLPCRDTPVADREMQFFFETLLLPNVPSNKICLQKYLT